MSGGKWVTYANEPLWETQKGSIRNFRLGSVAYYPELEWNHHLILDDSRLVVDGCTYFMWSEESRPSYSFERWENDESE